MQLLVTCELSTRAWCNGALAGRCHLAEFNIWGDDRRVDDWQKIF